MRVLDGSANFADQSLTPVFATGIQQLAGSITGLSSQQPRSAALTPAGGKQPACSSACGDVERSGAQPQGVEHQRARH